MGGFHTKEEGTGPGSSSHRGADDQTTTAQDDQITFKDAEVVINEDGDDLDFRVEASGEANALVVQGSDGNVGIGTLTPDTQIEVSKDSADAEVTISSYHDTITTTPKLSFRKAGGTEASHATKVADNQSLGTIDFSGWDGNSFDVGAKIEARVNGTTGDGDMPTELTFFTTPNRTGGATTPIERMTIDQSGYVMIGLSGTTTANHALEIKPSDTADNTTIAHAATTGLALNGSNVIVDTEFFPAVSWYHFDSQVDSSERTVGAITCVAAEDFDAANDAGVDMVFYTHKIATDDGLTEKMRILDGGNVGIGTGAPASLLSLGGASPVLGTDSVDGSDDRTLIFSSAGGSASITRGAYMTLNGNEHSVASTKGSIAFVAGNGDAGSNIGDIKMFTGTSGTQRFVCTDAGNVGIGTTAPGQLLDVNQGGGNMIADGYDDHSLAAYKENIDSAPGYLSSVVACPPKEWTRKPYVSAEEIKAAVFEHFSEDVLVSEAVEASEDTEAKDAVYERQCPQWDTYFPEPDSHRNKALYDMPEGEMKTWIDTWCETKRVGMRQEPKWQKKRIGLVADDEATAEHLPELIAHDSDGAPSGISTMPYIGMLHSAIIELTAKVEALENK